MGRVTWSRQTMLVNSLPFYPAVFLGGYALWGQSAVMFWVYAAVRLRVIVPVDCGQGESAGTGAVNV
jgi:hypothetical protein